VVTLKYWPKVDMGKKKGPLSLPGVSESAGTLGAETVWEDKVTYWNRSLCNGSLCIRTTSDIYPFWSPLELVISEESSRGNTKVTEGLMLDSQCHSHI
jgi:hypothetical protein